MSENQCVLACVTAQKDCARLIRRGSVLARESGEPLRVLHVREGRNMPGGSETGDILNELFSLAHEAEAEMTMVCERDVPAAIVRCAGEWGAETLVLGRDMSGTASRVRQLLPPEIQMEIVE